MKKLLAAGIAGVGLIAAGSASAADIRMPVKAPLGAAPVPYTWTGCYIGAHAGWGWGKSHLDGSANEDENIFDAKTEGVVVGGQVGCDYQFASAFVIGIEGSFTGASIDGDATDTDDEMVRFKTAWLASITGRLGWAGFRPGTLLYVKGGAAWAGNRYTFIEDEPTGTARQTVSGWTVGLGGEWAFAPNWSVKVEWNHYDFGTKTLLAKLEEDESFLVPVRQRLDTITVGVNYRFGDFGKAPVVTRY